MATHETETSGGDDARNERNATRATSVLTRRFRDGSLATIGGGAMLARGLKTMRKSTGRGTLSMLIAIGLFGVGLKQRRAERREGRVETEADVRRDEAGEKQTSDEAYVEREEDLGAGRNADETASVYQSESEPNPRGMTDRSDVEADAEGAIDFVEGKEPGTHRETHLEDEDAHDPRLHPDDDAQTEVDLSEAAMADEASEAAGPHPEQAYPAREGTDPEPTSENAPERVGGGGIGAPPVGNEDEHAEGGSEETGGESERSEERQKSTDDDRTGTSEQDTDGA